jgi:hypothetical protein
MPFWSDREKYYLGEWAGECEDNVSILKTGAKLLSLVRLAGPDSDDNFDLKALAQQEGLCP